MLHLAGTWAGSDVAKGKSVLKKKLFFFSKISLQALAARPALQPAHGLVAFATVLCGRWKRISTDPDPQLFLWT